MNKKFLFLSGEFRVSVPIVFKTLEWLHTATPRRLVNSDFGGLKRDNLIRESLSGFIFYANIEIEEIRRNNLQAIIQSGLPCWPNPQEILDNDDRHLLMKKCINAGLADPRTWVGKLPELDSASLRYPSVLKIGNLHCGEGKYFLNSSFDLNRHFLCDDIDSICTIEPFYEGESWRVLFIGEKSFFLRFDNPTSWIKNSSGADVEEMTTSIPPGLLEHAEKVRSLFNFEICGIDYIVQKNGEIKFLEYNMFPGVDASDDIALAAGKLFEEKMKLIENLS